MDRVSLKVPTLVIGNSCSFSEHKKPFGKSTALFCPYAPSSQLIESLKICKAELLVSLCLQMADTGGVSRWV